MPFYFYDSIDNLTGVLTKAYSARITQELGKYDGFTADFPSDHGILPILTDSYYVGVPIKETSEFEIFKIERPEIGPSSVTITGVQSAGYDLETEGLVLGFSSKKYSLESALESVFDSTNWDFVITGDGYSDQPFKFETGSKKALLEQVKETWGLTTKFRCKIKNNKILQRICYIGREFKRETGKKLIRGKDDVSWKYDRDLTSLYSGVLPIGGEVTKTNTISSLIPIDKNGKPSDKITKTEIPMGTMTIKTHTDPPAGKETVTTESHYLCNISDLVWSEANGDPLDKPNHSLRMVLPDLANEYAWRDSKNVLHPRIAVKKFEDDKDPETLARHACMWLLANSMPKVAITATADKIGDVELGDIVEVEDPHTKFHTKQPVTKIERNVLADMDSTITIGTYTVKTVAERLREQAKKTKKALKRHEKAIHHLKKKARQHDEQLKNKDDNSKDDGSKDGSGKDDSKTTSQSWDDTTGRFAMHFDKDNPNKVLTATFKYDIGSQVKFDGNSFTMTDKDGGAIGDLDPTGLVTLAEADVGTVKTPQLIGEGDNSLITNYGAIGQIKKPIGKVYSAEFDPVQVWPSDGSVVDDPDNTASFQANHLEINQKVGTYNQSGYMTSSGLTFSYPIMDGSTGSHGNIKAVLTSVNDDVPAVPMLYLSKGDHTAELTPYGLLFDGQNIIDKMTQVKLPDDMLTSKNLSTALNNLASGAIGGSKILTEQGLTDIFGSESSSGSYTPLVENLKDLILSKDFMDYICQELDAREYVKLSQVQSMLASSSNK